MKFTNALSYLAVIGFMTTGCASGGKNASKTQPIFYGVAVLNPAAGKNVSGRVQFAEAFGKVTVTGTFSGLKPKSQHGFHIHEYGDCTAPDLTSAGGHYNPQFHEHAAPNASVRHAGDMGNVETDAKGNAKIELQLDKVSVAGKLNPLVGRAVILHENADDLISQPTGGAGDRIACGVIGAAANP